MPSSKAKEDYEKLFEQHALLLPTIDEHKVLSICTDYINELKAREEIMKRVILRCGEENDCPVCGADLRKPYDCKRCTFEHSAVTECFRQGKHDDKCDLEAIRCMLFEGD